MDAMRSNDRSQPSKLANQLIRASKIPSVAPEYSRPSRLTSGNVEQLSRVIRSGGAAIIVVSVPDLGLHPFTSAEKNFEADANLAESIDTNEEEEGLLDIAAFVAEQVNKPLSSCRNTSNSRI